MNHQEERKIAAVIDGIPVEAALGMTILQAAREAGIPIPVLCEFPGLEAVGACRVCLVEAEKNPKLMTACSTPIVEGMVIHTRSPKVLEARRMVLELLLVRHPLDCFSCASNGKCQLQDLCYEMGIKESPFHEPEDTCGQYPLDDANPFYVRDRNKCVLCGRCVRACDSFARYRAVDFQHRGLNAMVEPPLGKTLENSDCVFCGQCVQVCPVGALYEKTAYGQGRPWELEEVKTVCSYCGVGCELVMKVNRNTGRIANVVGDYSSKTALNKGRTCVKGRFSWQFVHHQDRLKTPLIREGEAFREATWEEALACVAEGLGKVKKEKGPQAVGFLSSARCTNEENYLLQRLAREVVGTHNVDHCAHL